MSVEFLTWQNLITWRTLSLQPSAAAHDTWQRHHSFHHSYSTNLVEHLSNSSLMFLLRHRLRHMRGLSSSSISCHQVLQYRSSWLPSSTPQNASDPLSTLIKNSVNTSVPFHTAPLPAHHQASISICAVPTISVINSTQASEAWKLPHYIPRLRSPRYNRPLGRGGELSTGRIAGDGIRGNI